MRNMKKICRFYSFAMTATLIIFAFLFASCSIAGIRSSKTADTQKLYDEHNLYDAQKVYVRAVDFYAKKNFPKALELTEQTLHCNKNFYQASLLKSKILYFTDKNEDAEKIIAKLTQKYPNYTEARIWQIRILLQNHKFAQAKILLDKEITFNTTDWRIFYLYSLLAKYEDNFNLHLSMEKQAESILQESSKVFIDIAGIWVNLGLRERALDYLEKAKVISTNPESIEQAINHLKNGDDVL